MSAAAINFPTPEQNIQAWIDAGIRSAEEAVRAAGEQMPSRNDLLKLVVKEVTAGQISGLLATRPKAEAEQVYEQRLVKWCQTSPDFLTGLTGLATPGTSTYDLCQKIHAELAGRVAKIEEGKRGEAAAVAEKVMNCPACKIALKCTEETQADVWKAHTATNEHKAAKAAAKSVAKK